MKIKNHRLQDLRARCGRNASIQEAFLRFQRVNLVDISVKEEEQDKNKIKAFQ
jgi:hypothetical protein